MVRAFTLGDHGILVLALVLHVVFDVRPLVVLNLLAFLLVAELGLLGLVYRLDVGVFALHVPIFVEQVVLTPQFLSNFADQVEILLGIETRDVEVIVALVHHFDIDEALPCHHSLHESEVEAPYHDDAQNDCQRSHDDPVLDVGDFENCCVATGSILILRFSLSRVCVQALLHLHLVILL